MKGIKPQPVQPVESKDVKLATLANGDNEEAKIEDLSKTSVVDGKCRLQEHFSLMVDF